MQRVMNSVFLCLATAAFLCGCDSGSKATEGDVKAIRSMMEQEREEKASAAAGDRAAMAVLRAKAASAAAKARAQ